MEGLNKGFGDELLIENLSFKLPPGGIVGVIGPNGAGKSSLINVISGVYRADRGHVRLNGALYAQVPTQQLARLGVARTFQNLALFKGLNVLDNVASGLAYRARSNFAGQILGLGRSRREQQEQRGRADQILEFLHLTGVRDRLAGTLPYGLQKRV
ncbi:MAG: ABC transporter ATP-binding protein, partial [Mesorhizobium sp.]